MSISRTSTSQQYPKPDISRTNISQHAEPWKREGDLCSQDETSKFMGNIRHTFPAHKNHNLITTIKMSQYCKIFNIQRRQKNGAKRKLQQMQDAANRKKKSRIDKQTQEHDAM